MGKTCCKQRYTTGGKYSHVINKPFRCEGCKQLFNGWMSYADHAPFCEQLILIREDRGNFYAGEI